MVNDKKHYFPYLQTTPDNIKKNNLYSLPPCTEKDGELLPPWQEGEDMEGGGKVMLLLVVAISILAAETRTVSSLN